MEEWIGLERDVINWKIRLNEVFGIGLWDKRQKIQKKDKETRRIVNFPEMMEGTSPHIENTQQIPNRIKFLKRYIPR